MVSLSLRATSVRSSLTLAIGEEVSKLRAAKATLYNMSLGEPQELLHPRIQEAISEAVKTGNNRYTQVAGMPELRAAVAESVSKQDSTSYTKGNVLICPGTKNALYSLLTAGLNPGEEVVIPAPYWPSYYDMVKLVGGVPVLVNCAFEDDLLLTPEVLEAALTKNTTWLILNSPVNPSGMIYNKEQLQALGEVLKNHPQVNVIWDDIYKNLVYEAEFCSLVQAVPELKERVFTAGGVSKSHAMTGLRLGWCVAHADMIGAMAKIQSHSVTCASSISQIAALQALQIEKDGAMTDFVQSYKSRMYMTLELLHQMEGIRFLRPRGTFYFYVFIDSYIGRSAPNGQVIETDEDMAHYLLKEAGLVSVAGFAFGVSPALRLSYTSSPDDIEAGLTSMKKALGRLSTS